jgi:hypothetical protein
MEHNFNQPNPRIIELLAELHFYENERIQRYGKISNQLDMLFKDIDAGLFGDNAKLGLFYNHIKNVKDDVVKPNTEEIKAELTSLFAQ